MAQNNVQDIRNIAFCGNGNAGKTTLADKILTSTGTVKRPPASTTGPASAISTKKKSTTSIRSSRALVHFTHAGKHFNLLDTPGYPDFIGQALGALHGGGYRRHRDQRPRRHRGQHPADVPGGRQARAGADASSSARWIPTTSSFLTSSSAFRISSATPACRSTCRSATATISSGVVSTLKVPADVDGALVDPNAIGNTLIEAIIEVDEQVTERYFEGTLPTDEEISRLIVDAVATGSPGSAASASRARPAWACPNCSTRWRCARCRRTEIVRHGKNEAGADVDDQASTRPARWWPRCSKRASTRSCTS